MLVSATGLEVVSNSTDNWDNIILIVKNADDEELEIRWDSRYEGVDTSSIDALVAGDMINIVSAPLGWSNGPRVYYSDPAQVTIYLPPSDDETTYIQTFDFIDYTQTAYNTSVTHTDEHLFDWDILGRPDNGDVILGNADDGSYVEVTADGGISGFSVDLVRAFTNGNTRSVELFVNDVSYGTFDISTSSNDVQVFSVENINVAGDVVIRLVSTSPGSRGAFYVDNFSWTTYTPAA
jgi:hypothetical protein